MTGLVPIAVAAQRCGIKQPTIRNWVRRNQVAGRTGRPFLVHQESLDKYLLNGANDKLRELFSGQSPTGPGGADTAGKG